MAHSRGLTDIVLSLSLLLEDFILRQPLHTAVKMSCSHRGNDRSVRISAKEDKPAESVPFETLSQKSLPEISPHIY